MQTQTAVASIARPVVTFVRHAFGPTMIAFGLGLTAAWVCLVGYGVFSLLGFEL
jgi:hypothetical protein